MINTLIQLKDFVILFYFDKYLGAHTHCVEDFKKIVEDKSMIVRNNMNIPVSNSYNQVIQREARKIAPRRKSVKSLFWKCL